MHRVIIAGLAYFLIVFAFAFILGVARVLVVSPWIGEFGAVALELPLVLGASWLTSGIILRRARLGARAQALAMGLFAFALLMIAEAALSVLAFGRPLSGWLASLLTPAGALGLAGQIAFGLIPAARWRRLPIADLPI